MLVLIYKRASVFVQGSCPGWVVGGSTPRVEAILVNPVAPMLQAGIVQELRRSEPEPRKWFRPSEGMVYVQRAEKQSD